MRKAIKSRLMWWLSPVVLLVFALLFTLVSCEKDDTEPANPTPNIVQIDDFMGVYQVAQDRCNDLFSTYDITIVKETLENREACAIIKNFGNDPHNPMTAYMNEGKLEIPRQHRVMQGTVKDIEGYVFKEEEGVKIVLYSFWGEHPSEQPFMCEVYALEYYQDYAKPEITLPYYPFTIGKNYIGK